MKPRTLVTDRLYFGIDAIRLRTGMGRALARMVGLPASRARLSRANLRLDFDVDTGEGEALTDDLVAGGLLEPLGGAAGDFRLTPRFLEYAAARVVEPMPRPRAKLLLSEVCELALLINDEWAHNPLAIDSIVVHGDYMSRRHALAELELGVIVTARTATWRTRLGRMQSRAAGAGAIRVAMRELSSFVTVHLATDRDALPRPFSVVFQAAELN